MTIALRYVGTADERHVSAAELTAAGLVGLPDLRFYRGNNYSIVVDGLTAAYLIAQGGFTADDGATKFTDALSAGLATAASLAPIVRVASAGPNWTLTGSNAWVDSDSTGNATARTYDLVIPNVSATKWVQVNLDAFCTSGTPGFFLDAWSVVSAVPVRNLTGLTNAGPAGWLLGSAATYALNTSIMFQIQTGDLENVVNGVGNLRVRLRHFGASGSRTLLSGSGFWVRLEGRGPFG